MKKKIKRYYLIFLDLLAINLSVYIALSLKFGFNIPYEILHYYFSVSIIFTLAKVVIYNYFSLYDSLWEYASIEELIKVVMAALLANVFGVIYLFFQGNIIPIACLINIAILDVMIIGGIRFSYRVLRRLKNHKSIVKQNSNINILIIGAGATAGMIAKEILNHPNSYGSLKGFIDDDIKKEGKFIYGIKVLGNRYDIYGVSKKYNIDEIILAIPSADNVSLKAIMEECSKTTCKIKTVPV